MRKFMNLILENDIDDESTTPDEDFEYERGNRIEKMSKAFCEKELGWTFYNHSYAIIFDSGENTLSITPDDEEINLPQMQKLSTLGEVTLSTGGKPYGFTIEIKLPQGFDINIA